METSFKITYISDTYLIAELLDKGLNFSISENSFLGKIRLQPILSQPRALDKEGRPRLDLFVFIPADKSDLKITKKGMF